MTSVPVNPVHAPMRLNSTELSIECDAEGSMDSLHFESLSPIPGTMVPRKLDFSETCDEGPRRGLPPVSPPYRRVRALRLFDTPTTPMTMLEKCSTPTHHALRASRLLPRLSSLNHTGPAQAATASDDSAYASLPTGQETQRANMNPFTPNGQLMNKKKRALSKTPNSSWDTTPEQPAKRLKESNIPRYHQEFVELGVLGRGEFGRVTKCVNRLDGCVYALKRSHRPVAGSAGERSALNEVYAHAVLGKHPHVVRYYSAWAEDDHMMIQNEYCDRGSLQEIIAKRPLSESELLRVLQHVASGLKYIHAHQLVHMDIKPGNIFVCSEESSNTDSDEGNESSDDDDSAASASVYKIGDMGHVTCLTSPTVEEGDCRYLPKEVLHEDFANLTKADIFGLGLTLFEAGGGGPLPKNGDEWHAYRDGKLPDLPNCSAEFNGLLKSMVHPEPKQRPSASRLLRHALLRPAEELSKEQLRRELDATRHSNQMLYNQLQEAARCIKALRPNADCRTRSAKARLNSSAKPFNTRVFDEIQQTINTVGKQSGFGKNRKSC